MSGIGNRTAMPGIGNRTAMPGIESRNVMPASETGLSCPASEEPDRSCPVWLDQTGETDTEGTIYGKSKGNHIFLSELRIRIREMDGPVSRLP